MLFALMLIIKGISISGKISAQESQSISSSDVVIQEVEYLSELRANDSYVNYELSQIETKGYNVDPNVRSIDNNHVISYNNNDGTVFGMVQVTSDGLHSTFEMVMKDSQTADYIKINIEGIGEEIIEVTDNNIIQEPASNTTISRVSDQTKSQICSVVIGLAGHGIGSIYTAVAATLGGPLAAIAVGIINTAGWSYLTSYC